GLTQITDVGCSSAPCGHFETNPAGAVLGDPLFATGGRTPNDLLVTAQYNSGGAVASIIVYQWKLVSGTYQWSDITSSIAVGTAFVATNIVDGVSVPYGAFGATTYSKNQFVEMSLDATALITAAVDPLSGIRGHDVFVGSTTFTGLTAGSKTVHVVATGGCTKDAMITVTEPASAVSASSSFTAVACNGSSSTVTVSASGGTSPYSGTGTFTHSAGTYSFTVTDANSCTATTTGNITQPSALTASSSNTAILCNGDSSTVTVSASGGNAPYTGTGTFTRSAGTYSFTVTDANSCTATKIGSASCTKSPLASRSSNTAILCNSDSSTVTV